MHIRKLEINNFGLFHGHHRLDLNTDSSDKPVILIGGLNGSGKTTILNTIQLALFGKKARVSNRGNLPFDEYIRRSINSDSDNASILLEFSLFDSGNEQIFELTRSWQPSRSSVKETLVVKVDKVVDTFLTETWSEYVEGFVPIEIAELFFFDGEKIEGFADPDRSRQLLERAVNNLLGLDIVSRLQSDLLTLERKKRLMLKTDRELQELKVLEQKLEQLSTEKQEIYDKLAEKQVQADRAVKSFRECSEEYARLGGTLFDQQQGIEFERETLIARIREVEADLFHEAEGIAPLGLVMDLLLEIEQQAQKETQNANSLLVNSVLIERDRQLVEHFRKFGMSPEIAASIKDYLESDRIRRAKNSTGEAYLYLSTDAQIDLRDIIRRDLPEVIAKITAFVSELHHLNGLVLEIDRKLSSIPAREFLAEIIERRADAQSAVERTAKELTELDEQFRKVSYEIQMVESTYNNQLELHVGERLEVEDALRTLEHSGRVRETLATFKSQVAARHTSRIAELALDSFRQLLRKESLISTFQIDPETFELRIEDREARLMSPERFSAGERQLLAVSLLWGLARASGFPLPVIVDTPLGRLDSTHRNNLVDFYYPEASHQVILLSTNKEIDSELFDKLKGSISRCYRLEFDDTNRATSIEDGYFEDLWQLNTSNFLSRQKTSSLN